MENMGDYHDHYLKKGVLLLAVFEKFIDTCVEFYKLDPCHYFSSPGLGRDLMLKNDWCEIRKNIKYWHVLIHWKRTKRKFSYIAKRHAKANNKYMKNYDSTKLSKFVTCLNMSNLYGWAVSRYIPYGRFKWLKNADNFGVNSISQKSPIGYFLKVDWISWLITCIAQRLSISSRKTCNSFWHTVRLL